MFILRLTCIHYVLVLSRVQAFLPQLEASNKALLRQAQEDPSSVDIENVEGEENYIEMVLLNFSLWIQPLIFSVQNLGLGVFEDRSKASNTRSDEFDSSSESGDTSSSSSSGSDSDSDSDSGSSEGSPDIDSGVPTSAPESRPMKPLPRRAAAHPGIVLLDNHNGS